MFCCFQTAAAAANTVGWEKRSHTHARTDRHTNTNYPPRLSARRSELPVYLLIRSFGSVRFVRLSGCLAACLPEKLNNWETGWLEKKKLLLSSLLSFVWRTHSLLLDHLTIDPDSHYSHKAKLIIIILLLLLIYASRHCNDDDDSHTQQVLVKSSSAWLTRWKYSLILPSSSSSSSSSLDFIANERTRLLLPLPLLRAIDYRWWLHNSRSRALWPYRQDCFRNSVFTRCVDALLLSHEQKKFDEMVDELYGKWYKLLDLGNWMHALIITDTLLHFNLHTRTTIIDYCELSWEYLWDKPDYPALE